jgi:hypothetical protein
VKRRAFIAVRGGVAGGEASVATDAGDRVHRDPPWHPRGRSDPDPGPARLICQGVGACIPADASGGSVIAILSFEFALVATDFLLLPIQEIT